MPDLIPQSDDLPEPLRLLVEKVDRCQEAFDALWPKVLEQRRSYFVKQTEDSKTALETAIEQADKAKDDLDVALAEMIAASGIDADDFCEESAAEPIGDPFPKISRASIIGGAPPPSAFVEDHLPVAIEMIERHAPPGWLERESADLFRLSDRKDGRPISIVKGVRLESERPKGHRLRQAVTLARDYLANEPRYDHFAGALAVTQLAQLGARIEALSVVQGSQERINALFSGAATDAIMLELLVAAACAAKGRDMVFVEPTSVKSPDLRCNDPFNMVVECKRSSALTDYEIAEEAIMRDLFQHLQTIASERGQFGLFELELTVEASRVDVLDVAAKCLLQRLAARPERSLAYPWGSVAFRAQPAQVDLDGPTKAYSPILLDQVFGWDMEMPAWDGLICQIDAAPGAVLNRVRSPVGLAWRVVAQGAIIKRSRAPVGLFSKAVTQIPRGEFGLIYVAYAEGARPDVADNRTQAFLDRIQDWEHDAGIRVPASFLVRQYPRPTGHGNPDLIESTVKFLNEEGGGDEWIFHEYPAAIFTTTE
jgi:hypothetical protein